MLMLRTTTRTMTISARLFAPRESDLFGTLSKTGLQRIKAIAVEHTVPDDPDGYDKFEQPLGPRKNAFYYKYEISRYARQGKIGLRRALELFRQMKADDRLHPQQGNFSVLIYGCAKAGYTKKAFELFEEFLKYSKPDKQPPGPLITCLFNSCAESPFPEYALERLDWLRLHLLNRHSFIYNRIQYHSQIKAYGKLGQYRKAIDVAQEMIGANLPPDVNTFNMLLIGCASDKQAGLGKAIRIFRRIKYYNLKPNLETYRLFLRCVKDCKIGSVQSIQHFLGELLVDVKPTKQQLRIRSKSDSTIENWIPFDDPPTFDSTIDEISDTFNDHSGHYSEQLISMVPDEASVRERSPVVPNLLKDSSQELMTRVNSLNLEVLKSMYGRLQLVGNVDGILNMMKSDGIVPDIKTFTLLLSCLPRRWSYDKEIIRYIEEYPTSFDVRIFDIMIERNCSRIQDPHRMNIALQILEIMQEKRVMPSISTYEALALGCGKLTEARKLLDDLGELNITYTLIKNLFINARHSDDIFYSIFLIQKCQVLKMSPDEILVEKLEAKRLKVRALLLDYEQKRLKEVPSFLTDRFIEGFGIYERVLANYLSEFPLREESHPWSQFKVENSYKRQGFSKFVDEMHDLQNNLLRQRQGKQQYAANKDSRG